MTCISASKAMRDTFSLMSRGSSTRLLAFFQRCHAHPPTASPRAVTVPNSAAFHTSPSCTHR